MILVVKCFVCGMLTYLIRELFSGYNIWFWFTYIPLSVIIQATIDYLVEG